MFYDTDKQMMVSEQELKNRGIPTNPEFLASLKIYPLTIEKPEYDPQYEGIEPDGFPVPYKGPSDEVPLQFVQKMRVFNILDRMKQTQLENLASLRWATQCLPITAKDGTQFSPAPEDMSRISVTLQSLKDIQARDRSKIARNIDFKAKGSQWVTMTVEELQDLSDVIAIYVQDCYSNERKLVDQINAAQTIDELNAVDIQSGWPEHDFYVPPVENEGLSVEAVEEAADAPLSQENDGSKE